MNKDFLNYMGDMLKDEFGLYLQSLEQPFHQGFRINTLKIDPSKFFDIFSLECQQSTFAKNAYILKSPLSLGNEIFHKQGLIYIQEASAASVVDLLDIQKGDKVLDMCSAPGGKATQIAQHLDNTGLLVANEIDRGRSIKLLSNIERWGINNCLILNEEPKRISSFFNGYFDRVLIDAPCSGEGMFKKSDQAIIDWSLNHVQSCADRQLQILEEAYKCLKKEGTMLYSTCTLNKIENEGVIEKFINKHPDIELVKIEVPWGRPGFKTDIDTSKCRRLLPMDEAEGHFMAKMIKHGSCNTTYIPSKKTVLDPNAMKFVKDNWYEQPIHLWENNGKIYAGNQPFLDLKGLRVVRNQVLCGELIKGRFEPHQHFYTAVGFQTTKTNNCQNAIELNEKDTINYLRGNTLAIKGIKGFVALSYQGINVGFAKGDGNILKNKYPKGLRLF